MGISVALVATGINPHSLFRSERSPCLDDHKIWWPGITGPCGNKDTFLALRMTLEEFDPVLISITSLSYMRTMT